MKSLILLVFLTCVCAMVQAQVNFVKNPSFEDVIKCPNDINQVSRSKYWSCAVDTVGEPYYAPEYYNSCAGITWPIQCGIPENLGGFQYPRTGNAYIGAILYYDKTAPPPSGVSINWRDYFQGHLIKHLQNGKMYCLSFWINLTEYSGYTQNKIGAYLDNGDINKHSPAGDMITDVLPQVYSTSIIKDTMKWTKIEGSFIASGNETHITFGNFFKNADIDMASVPYYAPANQYSYYLFDDISVIPIDLKADAGADKWAEQTKKVQIGRVGDSTAIGLDCKWYHKGLLIDSGAIISVNANAIKGAIDTYIVVQNVCGNITRDTVVVSTVGLGILFPSPSERAGERFFTIFPNPSSGNISISCFVIPKESTTATVFDILGRTILQTKIQFHNNESTLKIEAPRGVYILELLDENGARWRERVVVE